MDDEDELDLFKTTPAHIERHGEGTFFTLKEDEYEGNWLLLGRLLIVLTENPSWTKERHKGFGRRRINTLEAPQEEDDHTIENTLQGEDQRKLVFEYNEGPWARHVHIWGTFSKIKGKYWWLGMYKDVTHFVGTCGSC